MSKEQPNLFGEDKPGTINESEASYKSSQKEKKPYLPQVKWEESYNSITDYAELKDMASQCSLCRLRNTCKQVVFGEGDINSPLMFIGEGPGQDEDVKGRVFVGKAGQLLDKIFLGAEIPRQDVYITNVIKCRPPSNRLPKPDEVKLCQNYLEAEIQIIRPKIIVCLGSLASKTVIDKNVRITKIRGKWFTRGDTKIIATFHPAALLRNEDYKRPTWEDFKLIRDEFKKL
ncbi:MAG TPA: uracil-DNA glycosylase [Syntrophomonadaceae bacterium]|nr:uracil-DNA glycosylase [Syntrophomonadaceae bacterium]